ncbi:12097_t:CDS:2, partial [Acaulospora colombiana]
MLVQTPMVSPASPQPRWSAESPSILRHSRKLIHFYESDPSTIVPSAECKAALQTHPNLVTKDTSIQSKSTIPINKGGEQSESTRVHHGHTDQA